MITKGNIEQAKQDHLSWMNKFKNSLIGLEEYNIEEIESHENTKLGKWFYSEVKKEYGELEPIKIFESKQIKLHELAKEIIELQNKGEKEQANKLIENLERNSKNILHFLNEAGIFFVNKEPIKESKLESTEEKKEELNIKIIDKILDWDKGKTLVIKTDTLGKIEYVNQAFLDVSGYESTDLLGKSFDIIRHLDMNVTIQKWILVEIMQGIEANVIVKCIAKSGKYFWALLDYKINMKSNGTVENVNIKFSGLNMSIVYKHIIPLYNQLFKIEQNNGLDAAKKYLKGFLEERNRTFDEFTRNLILSGKDSVNEKKSNFFKRIFGLK